MAFDPNEDQNALALKQFAAARQGLTLQKKAQQNTAGQQLDRQKAISGLQGGAALKAQENMNRGISEGFSGAQSNLDVAEAGQLGQIAATKQGQEFQSGEAAKQRQFATSERLGSQDYSAQQANLDRIQNQSQFDSTFGLQSQQLHENQRQFNDQMQYQVAEFNENQKTNWFNAAMALTNTGLWHDMGQVVQTANNLGNLFRAGDMNNNSRLWIPGIYGNGGSNI